MRTILMSILFALFLLSSPHLSNAAVKTYVAEFNVVGAPNKDELKSTLQSLLTSRLNLNRIQLVDKPEKAALQLFGNYAVFGKIFSIDVLIKNTLSDSMTKVFEQGANQDDLIPAFSRLAEKLDKQIADVQPVLAPVPVVSAVKAVVPVPVNAVIDKTDKVEESGYVFKSDAPRRNTPGNWTSEPLNGVLKLIALGRILQTGSREIFVAGDNTIQYFRKSSVLVKVAEVTIPASAKIVSLDTADLDRDGIPELYVSIIDRGAVSTSVYIPVENGLEQIASKLPWLLRGIGTNLGQRKVFAQTMTSDGFYFGLILNLSKSGKSFSVTNGFSLPKSCNLFNFNKIIDSKGNEIIIAIDEDWYLNVYSIDGNRIWKSDEKFGGSENFIAFENVTKSKSKINNSRIVFFDQKISILPDNTIIIPKNIESLTSVGKNRSFNKHSIWGFQWDGSYLSEVWRTRLTSTYLADYAYDVDTNEFVLLEVVQKEGMFNSGKTVISVNKMK